MIIEPADWFCKTCRFWAVNGGTRESYDEEGMGTELPHRKCLKVIHGNYYASDTEKATAETPAMVCDGSGYAASFWTLPNFGCTAWEKRGSDEKKE